MTTNKNVSYLFCPAEGTIYSRKNGKDLELLISRLKKLDYEFHFVEESFYNSNQLYDLD